jgi:hypothetical protein
MCIVFLFLFHYLVVMKTVRFETQNILCGTLCNFSGHCSFWGYHVVEVRIHLTKNSYYWRVMQPCNEAYESYCIHEACLLRCCVCQMCKQHSVLKVAVIKPSVQKDIYCIAGCWLQFPNDTECVRQL